MGKGTEEDEGGILNFCGREGGGGEVVGKGNWSEGVNFVSLFCKIQFRAQVDSRSDS